MYHKDIIQCFIDSIEKYNGIVEKIKLSSYIQMKFNLIRDRSIFYCQEFAVRFCQASNANPGNTVISLSALQKYDHVP